MFLIIIFELPLILIPILLVDALLLDNKGISLSFKDFPFE